MIAIIEAVGAIGALVLVLVLLMKELGREHYRREIDRRARYYAKWKKYPEV